MSASAADPVALPIGTVAFLMTDIEGSTRLVASLGPGWPRLLDDHFALMRDAVDAHGGAWVSSEGDSVFAVFPSVRQAIAAAVQAQRQTAVHAWPEGTCPRIRMGIHAGEAVLGGRDYTGIDVHRTARLSASGHGGQILVSDTARGLSGETPGAGLTYRDLGRHQLRDMPEPERIHQVVGPDLALDFPPLRTQSPDVPTNLPAPLTRFVGRTREVGAIRGLLGGGRLVTLIGPGGTGKTRLAIESAGTLVDDFLDGVWFVALDVIADAALVVPTIAATLAVPEQPGRTIGAVLADRLRQKRALLVLDNFEQVVAAAPDVGSLLAAAPDVKILATSREPLSIGGEAIFPVPPLGVPAEPGTPTAEQLHGLEAVDLFVERAMSVRPDFRLTDANAPAVAAICRRLDGLPLALELAAARSNLLSPDQILARLDHRLTLLASSRRDLPDRQRTLRGAIDWSYELLSEAERAAFRRFSVFSGGADVESLVPVIDPDGGLGLDVLDLASALVDRSLLRSIANGARNRLAMLETIREYAAELLASSGEERLLRDRHADHFAQLAETSADVLTDPRRDEILDRLDRELPNLRAAIRWSLEGGDADVGLVIASALDDFWHTRSHLVEGRAALKVLLDSRAGQPLTTIYARGVGVAAGLAAWHGDYASAAPLGAEALRLAEAFSDVPLLIEAHMRVGWAMVAVQPAVAREHFSRSIELARAEDDERGLRTTLGGMAVALFNLGELDESLAISMEALERSERVGDQYNASYARFGIAQVRLRRGDTDGALGELLVALRMLRGAGADNGVALALDFIALIAVEAGDVARAARLGAFADRLRREAGGGATMAVTNLEPPLEKVRRLLDPTEFERAVAEGDAFDLDRAEAEALAVREAVSPER